MQLSPKPFEIFSGTGGVGKTTLATSRAIFLASQKKKVLLVTIDPAKRLRQILGMDENSEGKLTQVNWENGINFDALLMSPTHTIKKIGEKDNCPEIEHNRIVKILGKPYGGMNEILSMVELKMQLTAKSYDHIILDTPPGSHFLDFLESIEKIKFFFDESFIDIFNYMSGKKDKTKKNLLTAMVSSGVKKLLDYLGKVTGAGFLEEFIEAIVIIYKTKKTFLSALELQTVLKDKTQSNWFLVTSVDQNKIQEAIELQHHAKDFLTEDSYMVLNKSLSRYLKSWDPKTLEEGQYLRATLLNKEEKLKSGLKSLFKNILEFDEVIQSSPKDHVNELVQGWKNYAV